jgi:hypothetical protein
VKFSRVSGVARSKIEPVMSTLRRNADHNMNRTGPKNTSAASTYRA